MDPEPIPAPEATPPLSSAPVEVTPLPSRLTLAKPDALAPLPMGVALSNTGAQPVNCVSKVLYILMKDYTVGLVTDPKFVQIVTDTQSVGDNYRNQFASIVNGSSVPYVIVPTVTGPIPAPPTNFNDLVSGTVYNCIFLSDELNRTGLLDAALKMSYYVFTDAEANEVGRVLCSRVLQWSDQMPLLLGS